MNDSLLVGSLVSLNLSCKMSLISRCAKRFPNTKSNFSIDHILNVAGEKPRLERFVFPGEDTSPGPQFEWLNCTRYKPPRLPRQRKKEGVQRRKAGRSPRIPFSNSQVALLEAKFVQTPYLSSSDVTQLASYLKLSETRVKIWFQNRRAREKREVESKSQAVINSIKDFHLMHEVPPNVQTPKRVLPSGAENSVSWNPHDCSKHVPFAHPDRFIEIASPLDLSESRPK